MRLVDIEKVKKLKIDIDDYDTNNIWTINHMYVVAFVRLDNDHFWTSPHFSMTILALTSP